MSEQDREKTETSKPNEEKKDLQERAPGRLEVVSSPPTEEEVQAEVQIDPLEEARKQAEENRDRWMRAVAELENYKKRMIQEKSNLIKYRNEELLRDLLVIMDNLERAQLHCDQANRSDDPIASGVCMISGMLKDILDKYGVKEIDALGAVFDPHFHEAIARVPAVDNRNNVVVEQMEKGYTYQDRLLRPAKVVVAVEMSE